MPAFETLVVFVGATLALALTPGPDLLYIATRSASEGRSTGWIRHRLRSAAVLQRISGCVFVALGARLALSERQGVDAADEWSALCSRNSQVEVSMIPTIETERLIMRAPRESDFATYEEFYADAEMSSVCLIREEYLTST